MAAAAATAASGAPPLHLLTLVASLDESIAKVAFIVANWVSNLVIVVPWPSVAADMVASLVWLAVHPAASLLSMIACSRPVIPVAVLTP